MKRILLILAILVIVLLLLLLFRNCQPQSEVDVSPGWSYTPEAQKPLTRFVPLADGGMLATTPAGDVLAIDADGNETLLVAALPATRMPHVVFNPTGDAFGILRGAVFELYDPQGSKISEVPFQGGMFKLVPRSRKIYSPEVQEFGEDNRQVQNARVLDSGGVVLATWPAPGLQISRLSDQHLLYATNEELVKTSLAGSELWRVPLRVRKLAISHDAVYSIVNSARESNRIHLFMEGTEQGTDVLDGPVWNIAISPDGRYAAASTQTSLSVYADGARLFRTDLNLEYTVSIAVNNNGEVLVGGQKTGHLAHVALYDRDGMLLWEESSGTDNSAWRPEVLFDISGDRYYVRQKNLMASYTIVRTP